MFKFLKKWFGPEPEVEEDAIFDDVIQDDILRVMFEVDSNGQVKIESNLDRVGNEILIRQGYIDRKELEDHPEAANVALILMINEITDQTLEEVSERA